MIDEKAKERALSYGTPECVHVPIAAVDEAAISTYVGDIIRVLSGRSSRRAFLVQAWEPPPRDERFPIWDLENSAVLFQPLQVWVHINYTRYRRAYRAAFPDQDISGHVLSHTMNRRTAMLMGFPFVRLTPTSRAANSSSAFSEGWGVEFHSDPDQMLRNKRRGVFIHYADLSELMLMLDLNLGGGVMNAVNEGQALIRPRPE